MCVVCKVMDLAGELTPPHHTQTSGNPHTKTKQQYHSQQIEGHLNLKANMFIVIQTILSILIIFQASTVTLSFSSNHPTMAQYYQRPTYQFSLKYHPETFERAVECARNYDMCDVDELLNLANGKCKLIWISN